MTSFSRTFKKGEFYEISSECQILGEFRVRIQPYYDFGIFLPKLCFETKKIYIKKFSEFTLISEICATKRNNEDH